MKKITKGMKKMCGIHEMIQKQGERKRKKMKMKRKMTETKYLRETKCYFWRNDSMLCS